MNEYSNFAENSWLALFSGGEQFQMSAHHRWIEMRENDKKAYYISLEV